MVMSESKIICEICPHHCALTEGMSGICRGRSCKDGRIICSNYGMLTSIALDPIEKKPLKQFFPGSKILSVGSYGCNMHCPFCQNSEISMLSFSDGPYAGKTMESCKKELPCYKFTPSMLVAKAKELENQDNIGIAYTYNEPLIGYEFVLDCARLAKANGLKNVLVTNGMICDKPLQELLPYIDAFNIDLKGFNQKTYDLLGGDLECVKNTIKEAAKVSHVEVTTLVVPGMNDSEEEINSIACWLSGLQTVGSSIISDTRGSGFKGMIPYHLSRFFPRYKMAETQSTQVKKIYALAELARKYLRFVYTGNC